MWILDLENCWSEFVTCFDETFINFLTAENYKLQKFEILIGLFVIILVSWANANEHDPITLNYKCEYEYY